MSHDPAAMISTNTLCEVVLLDSERHELLTAYEQRLKQRPLPSLALQMFVHNVRHNAGVSIFVAHAAELLRFANESSLQWLEDHIVSAERRRSDERRAKEKPRPEV